MRVQAIFMNRTEKQNHFHSNDIVSPSKQKGVTDEFIIDIIFLVCQLNDSSPLSIPKFASKFDAHKAIENRQCDCAHLRQAAASRHYSHETLLRVYFVETMTK